jgi:hypothetical protein
VSTCAARQTLLHRVIPGLSALLWAEPGIQLLLPRKNLASRFIADEAGDAPE